MSPLTISLIVLCCIFGSAVIGLVLRPRFPDEHLTADTKDVVKLVMGIVGTMTGMVLGLLVASAKSSFDGQRNGVAQLAANVVVLDRALAHYGTEAREVRDELRNSVTDMIQRIWPEDGSPALKSASGTAGEGRYEGVYDRILALQPKTDAQRTTQGQALKIIHDTAQMRWLLYSQRSSTIPPVFLVLMVAWLAITFACYGLFAPGHATTIAVLLLGSLVVSSAVFLILELDQAFGGMIHISSQPLQNALTLIGR
jgi:hypothetical protein